MVSTRFSLSIYLLLIFCCLNVNAGKECVFLHGSGVGTTAAPAPTFVDYWGNVHMYVTQCDSSIFIIQNTITRTFNDPDLMSAYCDLAVSGSTGKDPKSLNATISNKIVFTHSMGNDILAAAIQHGLCDFDSSSSWYEVSGPMHGSKAANVVDTICLSDDEPLIWLSDELGYCTGNTESPAYFSLRPSYPAIAGIASVMASRIKGAFCGISAFGQSSRYSVPLQALSDIVQYGEPNDGMVGLSSCDIVGTFGTSIKDSDFYQGPYNHADATCRNGGPPCLWYT